MVSWAWSSWKLEVVQVHQICSAMIQLVHLCCLTWLTSSLASLHMRTTFCCFHQLLICLLISSKNCLCGFRFRSPAFSSRQYCWSWYVEEPSLVGWLHDQYPVMNMICCALLPWTLGKTICLTHVGLVHPWLHESCKGQWQLRWCLPVYSLMELFLGFGIPSFFEVVQGAFAKFNVR